jgi:hypothetical protein
MHAILLLSALAGVSASLDLKGIILGDGSPVQHEARQAGSIATRTRYPIMVTVSDRQCATALLELGEAAPTAPPSLVDHMDKELCATNMPQNMTSKYSSWMSRWASFTSAEEDMFKSAKKECPSITKEINILQNMCAETDAAKGAAPREKAALMGAALVAVGSIAFVL